MARYYVMAPQFSYGRVMAAKSSFEARRVLAAVNPNAEVTDFLAVRKDLMDDNSWRMWRGLKNKS